MIFNEERCMTVSAYPLVETLGNFDSKLKGIMNENLTIIEISSFKNYHFYNY